jgi:hypothetical protein
MDVELNGAYWLGLVISLVLPVVVGLVTTRVTHAGVKAVLLLALAALTGFLVEAQAGGPGYDWETGAVLWLVSFATAVASHFGLWKPSGVSGAAQDVGVPRRVAS